MRKAIFTLITLGITLLSINFAYASEISFVSDTTAKAAGLPEPAYWYESDFDDSTWPAATPISLEYYHWYKDILTNVLIPGSIPIWNDSISAGGSTVLLRKSFTLDGTPTNGNLEVLVDDDIWIYVNGVFVAYFHPWMMSPPGWVNKTLDVSGLLKKGKNVLAIKGYNRYPGTTWSGNPGFVKYKLNVTSEDIDNVAPVTTANLDGTQGNNGWHVSDVLVSLSATDNEGGSGINRTEYSFNGEDWLPYDSPIAIEQEGLTSLYYRSVDNAGNIETAKNRQINIDKTAPVISIGSPLDDNVYLLNETLIADWEASDAVSGIASAEGSVPDGKPVVTSVIGQKEFTVTAVDNAGNAASKVNLYSIGYNYFGLLHPVNNDGSSVFKLGSTIPAKFVLQDANGNFVSDAIANLYLSKISEGVSGDELEAGSTSAATTGNLFRYDETSSQYIFNLSTKSLSVGTWRLRVLLDDGTSHNVNIGLK